MNHPLLQKASIVLSPTGYAEDFLHSIKPAQSFGSELVPNGTFDSGISGWVQNGGAVLSYISANNSLQSVSTSGGKGAVLTASITVTVGKKYIVKAECVSVTGTCNLRIGTSTTGSQYLETSAVSIPTIFEHRITATSTSLYVYLRNASASTTEWDNISIREVTDADLDFTRATTGTRVNESKLIEDVPYNLLEYSQDFTQWTNSNSTDSVSTTLSPDGSAFSTNFAENTSNAQHKLSRTVRFDGNSTYTFSVFVKSNGRDIYLDVGNNTRFGGRASFNLTTGVASTVMGTPSIKNLGNGWFRCIVTGASTSAGSTTLELLTFNGSTNSYEGDGSSGVFVWGAQVVKGDQPKDYLKTTDRLDIPRINYTIGVTENKGHLLLEPSSTNLVTHSEDLSDTFWTKFNTTVTTNNTTSPDGTDTASKITSSGTFANINRTFTKSASALSYTQSAFVKTSGYDLLNFIAYGSSSANRAQVTFSLTNGNIDTAASAVGSFTSASATITAYPNDWYKITLSYTTDTSTEVKYYLQFPIEMSTNFIYLWGAQLEQLPYCTSYIPTSGATVTRNADAPSTTGNSDLINASEGVLYFETAAFDDISALRMITIESADNNNRVSIGYSNTSNAVRVTIRVNGSNVVNQNLTASNLTNSNKFAFKYKTGASSIFLNGSEVLDLSSTSFTFSQSLTSLNLDGGAGTNKFYGKVKVLAVFKEVLTDAELTTLTS